MSLTAVQDIAGVVVRAVEYEGCWPKVGGIRGNRVTISQILQIGEKVRGTCQRAHTFNARYKINVLT